MTTTSDRLTTIANRQKSTRVRDAFFALCVALATVVALTSVSTAANAATPASQISR